MSWIGGHLDYLWGLVVTHAALSVPPILIGFVVSVPLGYWASRNRVARSVLLTVGNVLYTIPALALILLVPVILGFALLDPKNVLVALTIYAIAIMIRSSADAFASVSPAVRQSAVAQGFSPAQRFWNVELPLAGPVLLAGLRVVSVSTVSLATVGSLAGISSIGDLFTDGYLRSFGLEIGVGIVLVLLLAAVFDLLLNAIGTLLMPWNRRRPVSRAAERALSRPTPRRNRSGGTVTLLLQGIAWLFDGKNWVDTESPGLGSQLLGQLGIAGASVLLAALVAVPLGLFIGHTGRGRLIAILASNTARALPTLGLLSAVVVLITLTPDLLTPVLPLAILGIPPLLAGVYSGLEAVDRQTIDAARAMGMTEWQVITRVEVPLGLPLILGGLRATVLQIVATATLTSFFSYTTIGLAILAGPASNDYVQMIGGSLLVTALALALDGAFAMLQRLSEPRGVSRGPRRRTTTARGPAVMTTPAGTPVN